MKKEMSSYRLTFQDGTVSEQTFEGFLQFKNDEGSRMIVQAELINQWNEEVADPVAVEVEADKVEEVEAELVE